MICPLLENGVLSEHEHRKHFTSAEYNAMMECKRGECAWWHQGSGKCSIPALVDQIFFLDQTIRNNCVR